MHVTIFRDVQKATQNFTTILGQGAFGPVYKATMPAGEVVAVKVLSSNSKQGEKEFQTEVKTTSTTVQIGPNKKNEFLHTHRINIKVILHLY